MGKSQRATHFQSNMMTLDSEHFDAQRPTLSLYSAVAFQREVYV
jgi:hypothetical protein